jgi:O-antigen/teichoic acid export membrane protein
MLDAIEKKVNQCTPESLSTKVVKGGLWVFALRIINRGLGFVRTIILARLLAPEDFGLLGIGMLAILTLETFSQTGFQAALIQKKENIESYLDTAWTISAVRGALLFTVLFFASPLIATFFNSPEATLVIRVIAITTLLSGFKNIGIVFFQKELEFNKEFSYEFSATLVDLTLSISLAYMLKNVWALVWGGLAANLVRVFMSYILHPYRPRVVISREQFRDLFGFGRWVLGSSILMFLITKGDDILVGKMLGVTALGLYQMAYLISNLPATEITHIISQVTFPAYSKLQDDLLTLRDAYFRVLQLTSFLAIPATGLILVFASDFTQIFLGKKWIPMVPVLQVLAFWGMVRSIGATTGPVFQATGKPKILTQLQLIALILLSILIFPFTMKWGILGASLAVVISTIIPNIAATYIMTRIIKSKYRDFLRELFPSLINTIVMVIIILILKSHFIRTVGIIEFFSLIFLSILIYCCITYILKLFLGCYKETFTLLLK